MDKDRCKFTAALIRALEESELRRLRRSPQQLADAAWQKLQYDFPLVETAELQALLEAFSASFVGKAGWPCYLLTHKALENISHGARGAGSYEPQLSEQEQAVQQMLAESLTNKVLARAGSSSSNGNGSAQQQPPQQPVSQQLLYQKLAAVLLLRYAAKVASLPEQDAWQLMQAYCPEHVQEGHAAPHQEQEQQQQDGLTLSAHMRDEAAIAAALGGSAAAATAAAPGNNSSCSVYEDTEAAQQDADCEEYEPLEAAQPQQQRGSSSSRSHHTSLHPAHHSRSGPHQHADDQQPFSWPVLHAKLLSLSEHAHYSLFSQEAVWRQQDAAQHLLQLLRTLGVHAHAQELQPLLHAYVGLLVDRLATAPQDLPLLHQLWEALGLTVASGLKQAGAGRQQQEGLCPEPVLGLSVAAAVWQQLPGVSARKQLWQLMHRDLLPLLESCAEQLAYSSSSKGAAGAAGAACTQGVAFAHVLLLSHVLELLVLGRPAHVDVGKQLTELGLTRSLVQLHLKWGVEAAAEPLRRALLLVCCSSPHPTAWVMAVPGVRQQLQQDCFALEGRCESHGALWQLLMNTSNSQQPKVAAKPTPPAPTGAAASGAGEGEGAQQQLLCLLRLPSSSSVHQLQRQVVALQLMVDAQTAAGSGQRLWSDGVSAALRKLAAQLKEMEGPASSTTAAAAKGSLSSSVSDSDTEDTVNIPRAATGTALQQQQQQPADAEQLQSRLSGQLQPAALRLVKELLTRGGGKTD